LFHLYPLYGNIQIAIILNLYSQIARSSSRCDPFYAGWAVLRLAIGPEKLIASGWTKGTGPGEKGHPERKVDDILAKEV
jgi:hypothetical protein